MSKVRKNGAHWRTWRTTLGGAQKWRTFGAPLPYMVIWIVTLSILARNWYGNVGELMLIGSGNWEKWVINMGIIWEKIVGN